MNTKTKKYLALIAVVAIVIVGIVFFTRGKKSSNASSNVLSQENTVSSAEQTSDINKEYEFPIKDESGKEISKFKYVIESAEIRDEIVVKGQNVNSIAGRTFLVLNIKVSNNLDKAVKINTRDYIRLIRNGNIIEQLAPDVHNDPVEVQAISTKATRVAFPINDSDTDLQLQVGEIAGEKQNIPIVFN